MGAFSLNSTWEIQFAVYIIVAKRVTGGKAFRYIKRYVCVHWFSSSELEQDFRDAVGHASRQLGKPVIEDRILNQILYYLPQLYELNRDLLKELEERMSNW